MTEWITYGSQLATVEAKVRKHGADGYHVLPADNGMGDGFGLLVWVDEFYVRTHAIAEPFAWHDLPGGVQARWVRRGDMIVRNVRPKPAEVPA